MKKYAYEIKMENEMVLNGSVIALSYTHAMAQIDERCFLDARLNGLKMSSVTIEQNK